MDNDIEKKTKRKMEKVIETLAQEVRGIRTGRASAAILEGIRVDYYGSKLPLNQVGNINIPQPRMIEIKVWDDNAVAPVEKAIMTSSIGLTPNTDGKTIRLNMPSLTKERREDLIRHVHEIVEEFRVEVRNIRRDANDTIKKAKKSGEISEDEAYRQMDRVQGITDKHINKINDILEKKEKEIKEE